MPTKPVLAGPWGEREGALEGGAGVYRLAVRDDDVLERKFEQLAQRRQDSFLMPWRDPDAQVAVGCGQGVRKDDGALLGQPERRFVSAAAVIEGDEAAGTWVPGSIRVSLVLRMS